MNTKILPVLFGLAVVFAANQASAYYSPSTGRWLSRDPNGEPGFETLRMAGAVPVVGQVTASEALPPSRIFVRDAVATAKEPNRFGFVRDNPVNHVDPLGLTTVTSPDWFPGASQLMLNDNFDFTMNVNDGQNGTVELHRITMAELNAQMRDLVRQLQGYKKVDGCKSRKYEGSFDDHQIFAGEHKQHQYFLVDGQGPIYADNQVNYIGIGLYEAWLCDSLSEAKAIVWGWKVGKWQDVPSDGTMHWLEVGYNKYQTLKSADDSCCRCPGDTSATLRSNLQFR